MHKLLVFDLDGTLAQLGTGMLVQDIEQLKRLDEAGYRIAIASGKPVYYLCGFMRQIGVREPILIGENGATFQFGVDLPPKTYFSYPCSDVARRQLRWIKEKVDEACGDGVWYQPNDVAVTPFPQTEEIFDVIQEIVDTHPEELSQLHVYRHTDSFDIAPANVSKFNSLDYLTKYLSLTAADVIAYGDWTNDIPMFEFADLSVGVGGKMEYRTDYSFDTIGEALRATGVVFS